MFAFPQPRALELRYPLLIVARKRRVGLPVSKSVFLCFSQLSLHLAIATDHVRHAFIVAGTSFVLQIDQHKY